MLWFSKKIHYCSMRKNLSNVNINYTTKSFCILCIQRKWNLNKYLKFIIREKKIIKILTSVVVLSALLRFLIMFISKNELDDKNLSIQKLRKSDGILSLSVKFIIFPRCKTHQILWKKTDRIFLFYCTAYFPIQNLMRFATRV